MKTVKKLILLAIIILPLAMIAAIFGATIDIDRHLDNLI